MYEDVCLVLELTLEIRVVDGERKPISRATFIKPCDVEYTFIEGTHSARAHRLPIVSRYKFVNVFEALVIAHVYHHAAIFTHCMTRAFMFESAHGGSFNWNLCGVKRIYFNDPTEAIGFVFVSRIFQIKPLIK